AERREIIRRAALDQLRQQYRSDWQVWLAREKQQLAAAEENSRLLKDEIDRRARANDSLDSAKAALDSAKEKVARTEEVSRQAPARLQAMQVESQAPPRASLLEEAVVTENRDPLRKLKWTVLPALAAFAIVVFGVTWLESRTGRVSAVTDTIEGL